MSMSCVIWTWPCAPHGSEVRSKIPYSCLAHGNLRPKTGGFNSRVSWRPVGLDCGLVGHLSGWVVALPSSQFTRPPYRYKAIILSHGASVKNSKPNPRTLDPGSCKYEMHITGSAAQVCLTLPHALAAYAETWAPEHLKAPLDLHTFCMHACAIADNSSDSSATLNDTAPTLVQTCRAGLAAVGYQPGAAG